MDTLDFFRLILPSEGFKVLAVPRKAPYKGFVHHVVNSTAQLAELAQELDSEGETVYHACASYAEQSVTVQRRDKKTGEMVDKAAVRVASNAKLCRSFWVDLDVGDEEEKYPTQRAACADILKACTEHGLPLPMLVSSGYGIHAYWPLTADIEASDWIRVASRLKAFLARIGVKQDPTRTADVASVLRPAGVHNRKREGEPKPIRVVKAAEPVSLGEFVRPMVAAIKKLGVVPKEVTIASPFKNDLKRTTSIPSSAELVADKCAAIGHVRLLKGDVAEPFWRAAMGVVKHCTEGDELAHKWSEGHPSYDRYETQDKLDRWGAGPALCESFKPYGQCEGCQFAGKVKSPISLGRQLPESDTVIEAPVRKPEPTPVPEVAERDEEGRVKLPELPERLKAKFAYRAGVLVAKIAGVDGEPDNIVEVCQEYVVPHALIRSAGDAKTGNQAILKCWRYTLSGNQEEITVPVAHIATGGKDLVTSFGTVGMIVDGNLMSKYLKGWIAELRDNADDALSVERMGWDGDDFVLGKTRFTPNGPTKSAVASSMQGHLASFYKKGSLDEWIRLIDEAYGRPGQEQYQFMVGCGFGAPLLKFVGNYRGVIISAVSYNSGQGKTTTQHAAMSIYGDPSKLETAYGRQTGNALYEKLGAFGNLPYMIDEMTNVTAEALADMAYAISQGIQKDRLNKDGSMRAQREPWQTLVMSSGNRSLIQALGSDKSQREPEMRRIFEFGFRDVSDLSKDDADVIFRDLAKHYGVAGEVYLDYVVRNKAKVEALVEKSLDVVNKAFKMKREERFWAAAIASALAGLQIAKHVGLVSFDSKLVMGWVKEQLQDLRRSLAANVSTEYDIINRLCADMTFDLWVTSSTGRKNGVMGALVMREPRRGVTAGRMIVDEDLLFLRPEYVRAWCEERRTDYGQIRRTLMEQGVLLGGYGNSRDIMVGIANTSPLRGRVWALKVSKLAELSPIMSEAPETNVVELRPSEVS